MISRRGFFAVVAGVLAAPKALFGKKKFAEVACRDAEQKSYKIGPVEIDPKRNVSVSDRRVVFMGREAGRLAFGFSPEQVDAINRRSAEECRRRGIPMLKA